MIVSPFSSIQCRNGGIVFRRSFRTDAAPPGRSRRNNVLLTITPFFVDDKKTPSVNKLMLFYQAFSRFVDDVDDFSGCVGFRQQR